MTANKNSSRWKATELIELIANLIASYSHHNELYNSLWSDISHPELFTEEQLDEMAKECERHDEKMQSLLKERRLAMRKLKEEAIECDNHMRCLVKHSIASFQFSQEVLNTNMDDLDYMHLAETAYQYMYECVSKFLWVELVTCARCLEDELALNKNKNENDVWDNSEEVQG